MKNISITNLILLVSLFLFFNLVLFLIEARNPNLSQLIVNGIISYMAAKGAYYHCLMSDFDAMVK